jgi:vitamin B12 transporter
MTYGSDAIGGVINIITKRGQGPLSIRATTMGGSFNTGQASLGISGGDEIKYYSIDGAYYSTGGISQAAGSNGNTEHDPFKMGNVSGRVGYNFGDSWNTDYVFRYIDSTAHVDDFDFATGLPIDNLIRRNLSKSFSNRVQLSNWMVDDLVYQRIGFSLIDYNRFDTDPGPFIPEQFIGQTRTVDYFLSLKLAEWNTVTGGADYLAEDASSSFNPEVSQDVKGVYAQDAVNIGNFNGTAGVRWDNTSRAGPAQTYKVTGIYNIPVTASAIHSTIGTGFRQPALAENLFQFGNPNLRPETSKGWDAGWRQSLWDGMIVADATYYRNDFANLIQFDFNTFALENIGRSRASGVELSILLQISPLWTLNTQYTLDDTLNLDTNTALLRRPRDKVSMTLTRSVPDIKSTIALNMIYISSALDTNNFVLDDYTLLRLAVNRQLTNTLSGVLRLDNITNTHYEQVRGYGTPGFAIYGGINGVF